ncbi:hypothetical protein KPL78_29930 [Roseomonas sp. HJA6]|uniref:Right-handed parallel beta-helix repeat-containing protein n=1 Tax=Roseomonas alba TaxID=2846776 RepID=A0ABS7AIF7_9PROT|nr:hypothetical protein [Neoroseomonas alba]MBW6402104.1 hypothetical protein [Neoroseomonas alba]
MSAVILSIGVAPTAAPSGPISEGQTVTVVISAEDARDHGAVAVTGLRLAVRAPQSPFPTIYAQAQMTEVATGRWQIDLVLDTPGRWRLRAECDGPRPAAREILVQANASGVLTTTPQGALLVSPEGEVIATPDARAVTAQRIDRMREFTAAELSGLRLVGARNAEGGQVSYDTLRQDVSSTAASAGASAAETLSWDRISLRAWMEARGYVWGSGADAAPLINALLAQTVQGGPMSGKVIVCSPGLLPVYSTLRLPNYARNVAFVGDGNFRIEKRFTGALIDNQASGNAFITNANGERPKGIWLADFEMGAPYTPDPSLPNFSLTQDDYGGNTINFAADDVYMDDMRFWGLAGDARFMGPRGANWVCNRLDIRYGNNEVGQGGIRIVWADGNMEFNDCALWTGDDGCQPVLIPLGRSITGTILFNNCRAFSSRAHGACVYAGERYDDYVARQSSFIHDVIYRGCTFQGCGRNAYIVTRGTTGYIGRVWFDGCTFRSPSPTSMYSGTTETSSAGFGAIRVEIERHRGQPDFGGLGKLLVTNCTFDDPSRAGIDYVYRDGRGLALLNGAPNQNGVVSYYSGQPNTTPWQSVTVAPDILTLPLAGECLIENTDFAEPSNWRPQGLESDGVTPRIAGNRALAKSVSGVNAIDLRSAEPSLFNDGIRRPNSGAQLLFIPQGVPTGPVTVRMSDRDTWRPVMLADGVTQAGAGSFTPNASGFVGIQSDPILGEGSEGDWTLMTPEAVTAALTPAFADGPLLDLSVFQRVTIRGGHRRTAPGQNAIVLSNGVITGVPTAGIAGRHVIDGGIDEGLHASPLYGEGPAAPGYTPAWAADTVPNSVRGVWASPYVSSLLVTGGHRVVPRVATPDASCTPYWADAPAVGLVRGVQPLLLQNAQFDAFPGAHTYANSNWTFGAGCQYPAGWTAQAADNRAQTFTAAHVVGNTLTWDITKALLRQGGADAITLSTLMPSATPSSAMQVTIAAVNTGVVTLAAGGNLTGLLNGNPIVLLQGNSATFEWDPVSAVFRLVSASVPYSSLGIQAFGFGGVTAGALTWDSTKQMLRQTGTVAFTLHTLTPTNLPYQPTPVLPRRVTLVNANTGVVTLTGAGNITGIPGAGLALANGQSAELEWDPTSSLWRLLSRSPISDDPAVNSRVQSFAAADITANALAWDATKTLLRQTGSTNATLTTLTPSVAPAATTRVVIANVGAGTLSLSGAGNIAGIAQGGLVLGQNESAELEWDPTSAVWRYLAVPGQTLRGTVQDFNDGGVVAGALAWNGVSTVLRDTGANAVTLSSLTMPFSPTSPRRLTLTVQHAVGRIALMAGGNIAGFPPGGALIIRPEQSVDLIWDPTSAVWRLEGSPIAVLRHPGYKSTYYHPLYQGAVKDLVVAAADTLYLLPCELDRPVTIEQLLLYVSAAGASGAAAKLAVWQHPATNNPTPLGLPAVAFNDGLDMGTSGIKLAPVTPTLLLPGIIWLGAVFSSPGVLPTVRSASGDTLRLASMLGAGATAYLFPATASAQMTGYSTPLAYATDIATVSLPVAAWTPVMSVGGPPALVAKVV